MVEEKGKEEKKSIKRDKEYAQPIGGRALWTRLIISGQQGGSIVVIEFEVV